MADYEGLRTTPHGSLTAAREHELKTWPAFFKDVALGGKNFEVRRDDRDYQVGDVLLLNEWSPDHGYTGRALRRVVSYVLPGGQFGIEDGYVVMGLRGV